jgi:hypothetical protein
MSLMPSCYHRQWEIQLISKDRDLNLTTTFHHAMAKTVSLQPVTVQARFGPRLVRIGFMVDKVTLIQFSL